VAPDLSPVLQDEELPIGVMEPRRGLQVSVPGAFCGRRQMSGAHHWRISALALPLAAFGGAPAEAAPGDIHRVVNADLVNLRAGPSNESSVRGTIERGDEVIELTRRDNWLGVRVLRTGEEGWIFGQLLEPVALSTLGTGGAPPVEDVGFLRLSEGFNRLIRSINGNLGYPVAQEV
jgi:hypothetical protein